MLGKISRLPQNLRDELNHRLADAQPAETILAWLNALPEVQQLLKEHFQGIPISEANLCEYRKRGFSKWQIRQEALEFAAEAQAALSPSNHLPAQPIVDQLVHWISLRFAAAANTSTVAEDPESEMRQIRQLLADIVSLRRGDLIARRIDIEQQRLAIEKTKNQDALETLFWQWTKRPDIQAKLYPHRDPDKMRRDVVRMLDRELLGIHSPPEEDIPPDPAALI